MTLPEMLAEIERLVGPGNSAKEAIERLPRHQQERRAKILLQGIRQSRGIPTGREAKKKREPRLKKPTEPRTPEEVRASIERLNRR